MARIDSTPAAREAFGPLLRQYRELAGLGQERLAERSGLSAAAISNLERGVNQPRLETVALLADALGLTAEQRDALLRAARPDRPPAASTQVLREPATPHHNLPALSTSLLGRERDLAAAPARLQEQGVRLLTLAGVGGIGKTRLALALGMAMLDRYPDGVWLVELAPVADPDLVPGTIAAALGLREEVERPLERTLLDHLTDKVLLLVLDNCEHVVMACAQTVSAILRSCPGVQVLSTSREVLDVQGEHVYRVPSLRAPDPHALHSLEEIGAYPAVSLFLVRARTRRPDFDLTDETVPSVAEICRKLDGLPLAIELAAARVASLSLTAITERLDQRFRLLTAGPRDMPSRQQSLQAAIDWSWGLLSRQEQALLRRLAVFAGGWSLEAAEAIGAQDGDRDWTPLEILHGLVTKSLVELDEKTGRYRLLETVRQYGLERLAEAGELAAAREWHLTWCLQLAQEAQPALQGPEQQIWAAHLEAEVDNVRAALTWSVLEQEDPATGLLLAGTLWRFWAMRGHLGEGRRWLDQALRRAPSAPATARVEALLGAGFLAYRHGDYDRAGSLCRQSLELARDLGDRQTIARALNGLGLVAWSLGEYGPATRLLEESLALKRTLNDSLGAAVALLNLGNVAKSEGNYRRAQALYEEALAGQQQAGDTFTLSMTISNLGIVAELLGDYERAATLYRESLALRRELEDTTGIAQSLGNLALALFLLGEVEQAVALQEESLALFRDLGDLQGMTGIFADLGTVAMEQGNLQEAVNFFTESLIVARQLGNKQSIAIALLNLARAVHRQGDTRQALPLQREGLELAQAIGDKGLVAAGLVGVAGSLALLGRVERAAILLGTAEHLRENLGLVLWRGEQLENDGLVQTVRHALGEPAFLAAWTYGRGLSLDEAATLALADLDDSSG